MNGNVSIGYTPTAVNELTKLIADKYTEVGEAMATGWPTLTTTLGTNWVGPDEQDFEYKFAQHINRLYDDCTGATDTLIKNIISVAQADQEHQNTNRLQSDAYGSIQGTAWEFTVPTLQKYEMASIVKLNNESLSADQALGIAEGSGPTIKNAMKSYTDNIEEKIKSIYNAVSSNEAFHGMQTNALDTYIHEVGNFISSLATDVEEFYSKVDKLTEESYKSMEQEVSSTVEKSTSEVQGQSSTINRIV